MNNGIFGGINFNEALSMPSQRQQQSMVAEVENAGTVYDPDHFRNWEEQTVQDITLEQLRKTNRELNGGLPMHGIHHFELIEQVMDIVKNAGLEPEIFDMFAAKAGGSQYPGVSLNEDIVKTLHDENARMNVQAYTVRRVYTTIHIKGFDDGESDQSIALSYHQTGIQVAIGRNVRICHNQTILGADRSFQTYSRGGNGRLKEKVTYQDVLQKVAEWMSNIHNITFEDDQKIARMKATVIPPAKIFLLIGMLTATRVAIDSSLKDVRIQGTYPLNNFQINQMTEQLLLRNAHNQQVTAWDFYSIANDMYKPNLMDTTQLFPQNEAMVQFIDQYIMAPAV
jgi:hypothetical protein